MTWRSPRIIRRKLAIDPVGVPGGATGTDTAAIGTADRAIIRLNPANAGPNPASTSSPPSAGPTILPIRSATEQSVLPAIANPSGVTGPRSVIRLGTMNRSSVPITPIRACNSPRLGHQGSTTVRHPDASIAALAMRTGPKRRCIRPASGASTTFGSTRNPRLSTSTMPTPYLSATRIGSVAMTPQLPRLKQIIASQ